MSAEFLGTPVEYVKGLGPHRADLLKKELGIFTFSDLLRHYPFRYVDRSRIYPVSQLSEDMPYVQVRGFIRDVALVGEKQGKRVVANFYDSSGAMELVWFKGLSWITKHLKPGTEFIAFGKPNAFNGRFSMVHPELEDPKLQESTVFKGLMPVYPVTEKLKARRIDSKAISVFTRTLLAHPAYNIPEILPSSVLEQYKLMGLSEALRHIHFPGTLQHQQQAVFRLKFEELFLIQMKLLRSKQQRTQAYPGLTFKKVGDYFNSFYHKHLPFSLTNAQKRVIKEIHTDMQSGRQMNRLLQGDVGSGKTIVALLCMLIAIDNGSQAALMAPTEILATQHFQGISRLTAELGLEVRLLTGSTPQGERKTLLEQLRNGEIHILVGTHALIENVVQFKQLGLVIIDEQHRFGVAQRAKLWEKSESGVYPHILVMTATPIPRTLAMTLYGDLDSSIIDELPAGRKPILTAHRNENQRLKVYHFIQEQLEQGRQAYIVFPLIEESENADYENLMDGFYKVSDFFPMPKYHISMVHGRLKPQEKEFEMQRFKRKETHIMIATTVIEVGIDVPNANVMVIESAERFGLSQLHQLRGRVGRGAEQSYCILLTSYKLSQDAKQRMHAMVQSSNGFDIADMDLKLRGPGDLEGTQQSGVLDLKLADISQDKELISLSRQAAMSIIEQDPELVLPQHKALFEHLQKKTQGRFWSRIS